MNWHLPVASRSSGAAVPHSAAGQSKANSQWVLCTSLFLLARPLFRASVSGSDCRPDEIEKPVLLVFLMKSV